jgi:5,10-methylenetetrahydromethanopterin reductase
MINQIRRNDFMKRMGLAFLGEPTVPEMIKISQYAETLGFESAWVAETRFARDGFVPAAAIAATTRKIKISTGVVNVFTRNPVILATSYATLDELSGGRAIFGVGPGSPLVLEPQGHTFTKPITRLREYLHVAKGLIAGEEVHFQGEFVNVQGVKLEFTPIRPAMPVYLGVTGPKAMEYAGEAADGVLMNAFVSCNYVRRSIDRLTTGAKRTGRDLTEIDRSIGLITSVDRDHDLARDRVRPFIAMYLTRFPNIVMETGYSEEYLAKVQEAVNKGGLEAGAKLITEEVIDDLVAAGTPEHVRKRIGDYREAGIDCPVLFTFGSNINETIESVIGA